MKITDIEKYGKKAKGRKELIDHLQQKQLSAKEAIHAKCYDCLGMYADGKVDCDIPDCPLYPFMPYRAGEKITMRKLSDEQKKRITLNLPKKRAGNALPGHYNGRRIDINIVPR